MNILKVFLLLLSLLSQSLAFVVVSPSSPTTSLSTSLNMFNKKKPQQKPQKMINQNRRDQLGIGDDEDEYDLGVALANNTDPFISKVIAGSLILSITALLIAGIIVPALTDYGEGVCRPLLTGGRC